MSDTSCFNLTLFFKNLPLIILTFLAPTLFVEAQADTKERYFYDLYNEYYAAPIENFEEILSDNEVDRTYVIQRGDNLYDISSTLFGSPTFWPKIWSLNATLGNPHLIYEGVEISFSDGSLSLAPKIALKEAGVEEIEVKSVYDDEDVEPPLNPIKVKIPLKFTKKPLPLPPSLPRLTVDAAAEREEFNSVTSLNLKARESYLEPLVFKAKSIITTKSPSSDGFVTGIFRGGNNAFVGETVIIKSKESLEIGESLVTFDAPKPSSKIASLLGLATYLVQRTGAVRVDKKLSGSRYLAEVMENYSFVSKGNKFYRGSLKDIKVERDERPKALVTSKRVTILGGELNFGRNVLGSGDIVYLNKGLNANIELNGLYLVYTNRNKKVSELIENEKNIKNIPVSLAKIIDVEDKVATAVLIDNVDEVAEGDYLNIRETSSFETL